MTSRFTKPWRSIHYQVALLAKRGLLISNEKEVASFLRHLNYYRFSGYSLAFEESRRSFRQGTTFEAIRQTYEFDRDLRDLLYESMEVIELDVRSTVAHTFGRAHGGFGHTKARNFFKKFDHHNWLKKLQEETTRSREPFVERYKNTYSDYPDLPIWMAAEIMSFGGLSRMISGLRKEDLKAVAAPYGMQPRTFVSCLHHLVYVRNICAHHARLWDREWQIKPDLPAGKAWTAPHLPGNDRLFATLLLQNKLMQACRAEKQFQKNWRQEVEALITTRCPSCPNAFQKMGLPTDWQQNPQWTNP